MHRATLLGMLGLCGLAVCSAGQASKLTKTPSSTARADVLASSETAGEGPVPHPVFGLLTEAQQELLGIDKDANGVRDDVDDLISRKFGMIPLARNAVTAYAKAVTSSVLYADKLISEEDSSRRLAVFFCAADELIRAGVPSTTAWNKIIIARTADTEERLRAYDKWDRAQKVSTSINLETDPCVQAGLVSG